MLTIEIGAKRKGLARVRVRNQSPVCQLDQTRSDDANWGADTRRASEERNGIFQG
jgi:hypothetical protein